MAEPNIKGSVLIARLEFVRERGGDAALNAVLARLPKADQDTLRNTLFSSSWYPLALNLRLDAAIADELSPNGRDAVFIDMGRKSASVNLAGVHRAWVHENNPHFLLSMAPGIYRMYYQIGERTYEKTGEKSAVLRTYGAINVTASDCLTVAGWYIRAIEMCGGRNVRVKETHCRARGDGHCEYTCEWE
jgi:uncharacterized protein (TIGR02265 family)